jgi:hypothetical protein
LAQVRTSVLLMLLAGALRPFWPARRAVPVTFLPASI